MWEFIHPGLAYNIYTYYKYIKFILLKMYLCTTYLYDIHPNANKIKTFSYKPGDRGGSGYI